MFRLNLLQGVSLHRWPAPGQTERAHFPSPERLPGSLSSADCTRAPAHTCACTCVPLCLLKKTPKTKGNHFLAFQ